MNSVIYEENESSNRDSEVMQSMRDSEAVQQTSELELDLDYDDKDKG